MKKIYLSALLFCCTALLHAQQGACLKPVLKGQAFTLQVEDDAAPKRPSLLRGIAKTLGIGAVTYQATKTASNANGKNMAGATTGGNLLPPLGLGLAVSYNDFLHKRKTINGLVISCTTKTKSW